MRYTILAASILASTSVAFKNTSPFLVWSSEEGAQSEIKSGVIAAEEIYSTISTLGCDWNTLVVGHFENLHNSRVGGLRLPSSEADLKIPYLLRPSKDLLDSAVDEWAKICGAEVSSSTNDLGDGKNVIKMDLSADDDVDSILNSVTSPYILIVTGSHPITHEELKRQEEVPFQSESSTSSSPSETSTSVRPSSSSDDSDEEDTKVDGPLLERVQLLTVPIVTGLLIVFLLFLPILYIGISALAGIQVPPRMLEIGKATMVGKERKDQ